MTRENMRMAAWRYAREYLATHPNKSIFNDKLTYAEFINHYDVEVGDWLMAIDTAISQLPIVEDLHARYKHNYTFDECMDARMMDRLFEVDTMNDGCDSLIIADSGEDALAIVAEFCTNGEEPDPLAWANGRKWTWIG